MNIDTLDINYIGNKKPNALFDRVLREAMVDLEIQENEVKLQTLFIEDAEEEVTASLAIINALGNKVNFDKMELCFVDTDGERILTQATDLNFLGVLPSNTITPFEIKFNKKDFQQYNGDITKLSVKFSTSISAHNSTKITSFEADENVSFNDKVAAKIYLKEQPPIKDNSISIKSFKPYIVEDKVVVPIIVINSYNEEATINRFTVQLLDFKGMAKATQNIQKEIRVKANSGILTIITFSGNQLSEEKENYINCTAVIS